MSYLVIITMSDGYQAIRDAGSELGMALDIWNGNRYEYRNISSRVELFEVKNEHNRL